MSDDADDYRRAERPAPVIDQALADLRPAKRKPAKSYTFEAADLEVGIPPEYRGAVLAPVVKELLTSGEPSVTLIGPPGTGKTYQAWAALRAHRLKRCGHLVGAERSWIVASDAPLRREWVHGMLDPARDRIRIISESGDIQRHRFDRDWLDRVVAFPHLLVVDDIGYAEGGDWPVEAVYHLANERRAWARPTMWTTNLTPAQIRDVYTPAIASRLLGGIVRELDGTDRRVAS